MIKNEVNEKCEDIPVIRPCRHSSSNKLSGHSAEVTMPPEYKSTDVTFTARKVESTPEIEALADQILKNMNLPYEK